MEVLWITGGAFALFVGMIKLVQYTNRKETYKRAVKISRGE